MTIQITRPEVEMLINRRLETGPFTLGGMTIRELREEVRP